MGFRLLAAVLLAACALVLAACGGDDAASVATGDPIGLEQLSRSATASADATSGRFSFEVSMTFPGADDPFALSGEGAFDAASERASFAVDMSSLAELLGGFLGGFAGPGTTDMPDFGDPDGWKIEVVTDGDVGYVRFPALDETLPDGKTWIRSDRNGTGAGASFDFDEFEEFARSDPRELLDALRATTGEVETVGTETLRGVETTHYRVTVDPAELATLPNREGRQFSQTLVDQITSQSGLGEIPFDVWIDASGLVRKLSMAITATQPGTSETSEVSIAFELWDYGEPVAIELPPPSQVADASAVGG